MGSNGIKITSLERSGLLPKAPRDSSFICRFEAEWGGDHFVVWYDMEGEIAAHLSPIPEAERWRLVEGLYAADLKMRIANGELTPGRSNVYFALSAKEALSSEVVVPDALERVRALPGAL